jgi:urocanate hydratase
MLRVWLNDFVSSKFLVQFDICTMRSKWIRRCIVACSGARRWACLSSNASDDPPQDREVEESGNLKPKLIAVGINL